MSLPATIKSIQDIMRKDAGVDGDAQRIGQLAWMTFYKIYSDLEAESELLDDSYASPIPERLHWDAWADEDALGRDTPTGDELLDLIDNDLFPSLKNLDLDEFEGETRERAALLRGVFEDAINYMKSGTLMRQVINKINYDIDFNEATTRHVFGEIYETILLGLQSAGNAGEFYTPRPVTQFAMEMVDPQVGETVLDPACGTGGFLTGAYEHMRQQVTTAEDLATLKLSIRGIEKKQLPHLLCVTNMMVHGIEVPSGIRHDNTLARPLRDYTQDDEVEVILTNPPFQGMEEDGIQNNFPRDIRTRETADLFLALAINLLKSGGRAAIVLPDSSLFGEGVKETLRRQLIAECNLHTIVRLPHGVFSPYTDIKTNVLFFEKGKTTDLVWYYEVPAPPSKKFTKTKPIAIADFDDVREWWNNREPSAEAWALTRPEIESLPNLNLDVPNPNQRDVRSEFEAALGALEGAESFVEVETDLIAQEIARLGLDRSPATELFRHVERLAPYVRLTSGLVEDLRLALTEMAARGLMSSAEPQDESIEETLARYGSGALANDVTSNTPFDIPAHWIWKRLSSVSDFAIGKTPATRVAEYWDEPDSPEAVPFITISDMPRRGRVESTDRWISKSGAVESIKRDPLREGTLLMAFKLSVGKTAISGLDTAFFNEAIAAIDVADQDLRHYLLWILPALALHGSANPAVRGATLNKKSIAALWVPIPPLEEQRRLVGTLSCASDLLDQYVASFEPVHDTADAALKLIAHDGALTADQAKAD